MEKIKEQVIKKDYTLYIVAALFAAVLIAIVIVYVDLSGSLPKTVHIENMFVDLNGDKKVDYLLKGDVILNTDDAINLLTSQSKQK